MGHRLDPLLNPASIAVVGASRRQGAVGNMVLQNLLSGGYPGILYAVNPGYPDVLGVPCYPQLAALPSAVEQVIFAVGDANIEAALDAAIEHGIRTCIIFSTLVLADDAEPVLKERVRSKVADAKLLLCGGNGMGFYNFSDHVWACGFDTRRHRADGGVTLISQSGSGMSGIVDVDERIDFNLAVSTGQELAVTLEDYLDYALDQPQTRVVGLFLETSRAPDRLIAAFAKARERRIPVVAIKVGRTDLSAELALSHCGALAGADSVYDAVFAKYGVQRVSDMDELATTLIMFAQPHGVAAGGLATIHDSGGERQLTIDLADRFAVPLARLAAPSVKKLQAILDPGLPAVNPLDAWSAGGPGYHRVMSESFSILLADADSALGAVVHDRAPDGRVYPEYIDYMRTANRDTGKPVFLVANRQGTGADPLAVESTRAGFPVLDGLAGFMRGVRCLLDYRDFQSAAVSAPPLLDPGQIERWRNRLLADPAPSAAESLGFLQALGIPAVAPVMINSEAELRALAASLAYPAALKTARADIRHKTECGGVMLDIADAGQLARCYRELADRLGDGALVVPMDNEPGVEMILGLINDGQFGPVVVLGMGGIYTEVLGDSVTILPPFDKDQARRALNKLAGCALLQEQRGRAAFDIDALCNAAACLSVVAVAFADVIAELDINPFKVTASGCRALDAMLVPVTQPRAGARAVSC